MGYITLDQKAFSNNVKYYSTLLGSTDKICVALKDNAYGHGVEQIAKLSYENNIKHCMVRDINEANIASQYQFETVLVLYDIPTTPPPSNHIFAINSLENISQYPKNTKVELKIDTNMSRNGILVSDVFTAIELIKTNHLILHGVFTHFCCADEDNNLTHKQEKIFLELINKIKLHITTPFRIHCSNTAGVHRVNNDLYDMARIGIGIYGYSEVVQNNLMPVLSLWANKISTRVLSKDTAIGYGATFKIKENNTKISNYDIGYGDGFFRLNERKKVSIQNGKQILGRVSMDSFSIDGDDQRVCVFSNVTPLAKVHDTIEYEILTHLMPRLKRIIV